jgi:hypothetical protein
LPSGLSDRYSDAEKGRDPHPAVKRVVTRTEKEDFIAHAEMLGVTIVLAPSSDYE